MLKRNNCIRAYLQFKWNSWKQEMADSLLGAIKRKNAFFKIAARNYI